jgi:hypothetical protein
VNNNTTKKLSAFSVPVQKNQAIIRLKICPAFKQKTFLGTPFVIYGRNFGPVATPFVTFLATGMGLQMFHMLDGHLDDLRLLDPALALLHVRGGDQAA